MTIIRMTLPILLVTSLCLSQTPAQEKDRFARWEKAIKAFEELDKKNPPPENAVLFVGSSSIRLWDLKKSFPYRKTINRGFGGSQIIDAVHFAPRIVIKYKPKIIVMYAGDNDIAQGKDAKQVLEDFKAFVKLVHAKLPNTKIIFICVKPSGKRWNLADEQRKANANVEMYCKTDARLAYVDIYNPMLGANGKPRQELFLKDQLHMNEAGYQIWTKALRPHLK